MTVHRESSATELAFIDGEVTLNMMPGSVKLRDVRRDPRVAIHSPTVEVSAEEATSWLGDAKMAGVLVEVAAPARDAEPGRGYFRLDINEVVQAYLDVPADEFVVESWHEGRGVERRRGSVLRRGWCVLRRGWCVRPGPPDEYGVHDCGVHQPPTRLSVHASDASEY